MCVVSMLALLKKIFRQAPSKRDTLESIKKHLWYRNESSYCTVHVRCSLKRVMQTHHVISCDLM